MAFAFASTLIVRFMAWSWQAARWLLGELGVNALKSAARVSLPQSYSSENFLNLNP